MSVIIRPNTLNKHNKKNKKNNTRSMGLVLKAMKCEVVVVIKWTNIKTKLIVAGHNTQI